MKIIRRLKLDEGEKLKTKDFVLNNNNVLEFKNDDGMKIFFSTNKDGVSTGDFDGLNLALHVGDEDSKVIENRNIYANKIGMKLEDFVYSNQTHSDLFYEVTSKDLNKGTTSMSDAIEDVDCLYTFEDNIVLNMFYADCTPVYFYSKVDNLIGVIHAGWQGTVKEITFKVLTHIINDHKVDPSNLTVIVGPSINQESFEVESDVIEKLNNCQLDYKTCYFKKNVVKYKLDVKKMNMLQAQACDIDNIFVSEINTYDSDYLYSYRRNNVTGRMSASIFKTSR